MKTVFFESLRYKFITKNDFYHGSCPDIHITRSVLNWKYNLYEVYEVKTK